MSKSALWDCLCCPECKSGLAAQDGCLVCRACRKKYPFVAGIPVLIDLENLPLHLRSQAKYFEWETRARAEGVRHISEPWQESFWKKFEKNRGKVRGAVAVDCGTGSGYMALALAKRGASVIACDLTLHSLAVLWRKAEEMGVLGNVLLVCCTAESLPFKAGIADYFISNSVLEHIPQEAKAISEMDRVSKEGALLMITVPMSYRYINPLLVPFNLVHDRRMGHLRRYDEEALKGKLGNWELERAYFTGHSAKVAKFICNATGLKAFDPAAIEAEDALKQERRAGAHNITAFFKKKNVKIRGSQM
jgi:ubiquinone/menaquinone biosynthesis C-methylase UbiE/uncharacterized protein YbaR (Trm112 family)